MGRSYDRRGRARASSLAWGTSRAEALEPRLLLSRPPLVSAPGHAGDAGVADRDASTAIPVTSVEFVAGSYASILKASNAAAFVGRANAEIAAYTRLHKAPSGWHANTGRNVHITYESLGSFSTPSKLDRKIDARATSYTSLMNALAEASNRLDYQGSYLQVNHKRGENLYLVYVLGAHDQEILRGATGLEGKEFHVTVGHFGPRNEAKASTYLGKLVRHLESTGLGGIDAAPENVRQLDVVRTDNDLARYHVYRSFATRSAPGSTITVDYTGDAEARLVESDGAAPSLWIVPAAGRRVLVDRLQVEGSLGAIEAPRVDLAGTVSVVGEIGRIRFRDVVGRDDGESLIRAAGLGTLDVHALKDAVIDVRGDVQRVLVSGLMSHARIYAGVAADSGPVPDRRADLGEATIGEVKARSTVDALIAAKHLEGVDLGRNLDDRDGEANVIVTQDIDRFAIRAADGRLATRDAPDPDPTTWGLPSVAASWKLRFAVASDSHVGSKSAPTNASFAAVAKGIEDPRRHISFVLFAGDLVDRNNGSYDAWKSIVDATPHGPAWMTVPGNHDSPYPSGADDAYARAFPDGSYDNDRYETHLLVRTATNLDPATRYDHSYWFNYGSQAGGSAVLFVGLDNFAPADRNKDHRTVAYKGEESTKGLGTVSQDQVDGMNKVAPPSGSLAFLFGHVPADQLLVAGNPTAANATALFRRFVSDDGAVYFAGHTHATTQPTRVNAVDGLYQLTDGNSGGVWPHRPDYTGFYEISVPERLNRHRSGPQYTWVRTS